MPTSYTSLLGLALPVTGELAGTWGDTVNDYISKYVDSSVAGTQTISGSQTAVTLTRANGAALSQAGSGATGSSQYQVINCTGNPAGTLTVTIDVTTGSPTLSNSTYSQTFAVINGTSTSQSVVVRATTTSGTSTGTTLVSGEKALIAWNGSDFIKVATSTVDGVSTIAFGTTGLTPSSATSGAVTVAGTLVAANGGTGQSTYTTGDLLYATGSTALSKLGIGTNGQILTSTGTAPQWSTLSGVAVTTFSAGTTGFTPSSATSGAVTLAGTLATTNGGTGLTSFTANGVVYASSTSALTTGSALSFDGSNLTLQSTNTAVVFNNSSATPAFQVGYIGGTNRLQGRAVVDAPMTFYVSDSEQMRLTSTGLGIGASLPGYKLTVAGTAGSAVVNLLETGVRSWGIRAGGSVTNTFDIADFTASATRLTIDSSGNLGLGVTPSAWSSSFKALNIGVNGQSVSADGGQIIIGSNYVQESGGAKYVVSAAAGAYAIARNSHYWYNAASGTAGNAISFTQAMTLDASGYLLVGATSSAGVGNARMQVGSTSAATTQILIQGASTHLGLYAASAAEFYASYAVGSALIFGNGPANGSTFTERARITSGGDLLVGTTSAILTTAGAFIASYGSIASITATADYSIFNKTTNSTGKQIEFRSANTAVGYIESTSTATSYNTSSDYRLKDNPQPLTGSGAFIDALKPKTWDWKSGGKGVGFIAHEVQEVSPSTVSGSKDAVDEEGKPIMQAMEYGSAEFIANIIAELQSLRARVAQLEAK